MRANDTIPVSMSIYKAQAKTLVKLSHLLSIEREERVTVSELVRDAIDGYISEREKEAGGR